MLLKSGRGLACQLLATGPNSLKFIVPLFYRIGLFCNSILSTRWTYHQTTQLPGWPLPKAHCRALARLSKATPKLSMSFNFSYPLEMAAKLCATQKCSMFLNSHINNAVQLFFCLPFYTQETNIAYGMARTEDASRIRGVRFGFISQKTLKLL